MLWPGNKKKAVTLSYDDGTLHDRRFIELLNKYGVKCTFNLVSGCFRDDYLTVDPNETPIEEHRFLNVSKAEVAELYKGHEVATHSLTHPNLTELSYDEVCHEINEDVKNLEKLTGEKIKGFAYPYGAYDDNVIKALKDCNIKYARTVNSTKEFTLPEDFLLWHPTAYHEHEDIMETVNRFLESDEEGILFYLWGHSYEFYIGDKWGLIEDILKAFASHADEIWFATNGEIYDYVTAK